MAAAARFDAKNPSFEFESDGEAKRQAASPVARAATKRWVADVYDRLEQLRAPISAAKTTEQG